MAPQIKINIMYSIMSYIKFIKDINNDEIKIIFELRSCDLLDAIKLL